MKAHRSSLSCLQDALSIVLFHVFLKAALPLDGEASPMMGPTEMWGVALDVLKVCAGSVILGILWALASAFLSRKLRVTKRGAAHPHASFELALLLLFALLTYTTAEECGFSGVMSLFVCALVMRHYTFHNLTRHSRRSAKALLTTLSETCETCLSVLLGIVFVDYLVVGLAPSTPSPSGEPPLVIWDLAFVALSLPILLVARAFNIFFVSALSNLGRRPEEKITMRMQMVMWFSGMRGPLSFALAVTLPGAQAAQHMMPGAITDDARWTVPLNTTTLAITLITNLLMAPLTGPLIKMLDLQADDGRRTARGSELSAANTPRHTLDAAESGDMPQPVAASEDAAAGATATTAGASASGSADGAQPAASSSSSSLKTPLIATDHAGGSGAGSSTAPVEARHGVGFAAPVEHMRPSACLRAWKLLDREYMKPLFGGRRHGEDDEEDDEEEE